MSYWKTMPVIVHKEINKETFTNIVSNQSILDKIDNENKNIPEGFTYKIFEKEHLTKDFILEIKEFFDINYSDKIEYDFDFYKFFMNNGIVFVFYKDNLKIGYLISKKKTYVIYQNIEDVIEVSFLCILKSHRNLHITPYIINIIVKESILRYNISINTYSISSTINSTPYCTKRIFHRPIKIDNLLKNRFLHKDEDYNEFYKFNTSKYRIEYYNKEIPNSKILDKLYLKLQLFKQENFKMYEIVNISELIKLFNNNSFEHFIFYDKNNNIINYVCNYLITIKTDYGSYTNSTIYSMFLNKYTVKNISKVLESISYFHYQNKSKNSVDLLSFYDMFNDTKNIKCLSGEGITNYYIFNYKMFTIKNTDNCIVHI